MTLHVLGLPWTETTSGFLTCAYTQKIVKFGAMMTGGPHKIIIYSGAENEAVCDEHVPLYEPGQRETIWGRHDPNTVWGHISWDRSHPGWRTWNLHAEEQIWERKQQRDLVLIVAGSAQTIVTSHMRGDVLTCEPFVGYYGIDTDFCAFESIAWRHHVYGNKNIPNGRWMDVVIPNYFDVDDFHLDDKEDYLLYVGRVTALKGVQAAADLAKAAGMRIVFAGGGVTEAHKRKRGGYTVIADGCTFGGSHVEYVGPVGGEERKHLMARAAALVAPTLYLEPFGGVAVEAMLSGTPVVASDWGAFTETVIPGLSGYRFRNLRSGVEAIHKALLLDSEAIRDYAIGRYSLEAVRPQFEDWFQDLSTIWEKGWYTMPEEVLA